MNTRREVLGILMVAALACQPLWVGAQENPFRIGVSNDQSGPYADQGGPGSAEAVRMAVEDFGGSVLGRKIEVLVADNQNKPDVAGQIARRWFDVDGVNAIVDGGSSAAGLASQLAATDRHRVMLVTGGTAPDFVGKHCSPYGTQWASSSYSMANSIVRDFVAKGGKKWFFLTTDFVFGHALESETVKALKNAGGTTLGSVKHPINTSDFSSYLLQAQTSGADVIALAAGGGDLIRLVAQAREFQVPGKLAALYVSQAEVDAIGLEAAQGLRFVSPFYWDLNDKTRDWAMRFKERHGKIPTMIQANSYASVSHYLKAVQAAGTDDAKAIMAKMHELPITDSVLQNTSILPNGRVAMDMFILQVKKPEDARFPGDSLELVGTLPAAEIFEDPKLSGCALLQD